MKSRGKGSRREVPPEGVVQTINRFIPGFHGFFKKMEGSKTFGSRVSAIRKEMDRRFGLAKK